LWYDKQDFSASFEHAVRMHSALQRLGKPVELLALKMLHARLPRLAGPFSSGSRKLPG
jgi:hypothetical protein